ncbi:MAG: ISKra4 family transposase, partial [Spirochaetaceae bacterium]|nr:ISKra4 family transposase [Spirochaetaceae bacterium]
RYEPWAKEIIGLAKESKTEELLERLVEYKGRSLPTGVPNLYGYVNNNREKIDYGEYRKQGYYVGSGPIESGNKVVVQRRCKQAGMRWDETNAIGTYGSAIC